MKVSIIVPVYNEQRNIKKLYDSVIVNGYDNFELIFIDDGSTDDSLQILSEIKEKDNRVKLISQANCGVSVARNNGIIASTGDYIMFCDCDDLIIKGSLKAMLDAIFQTGSPIVQGCFYSKEGLYNDSSLQTVNSELLLKSVISCGFTGYPQIPKQLIKSSRGIYGKIYNSSIIKNQRFLKDLKIGEDLLFLLNIYILAGQVTLINKEVYFITPNQNSSTRRYNPELIKSCMVFINEIDNIVKQYNLKGIENELLYIKYLTCNISVNSSYYHPLAYDSFNDRYKEYKAFFSTETINNIYSGIFNMIRKENFVFSKKDLLQIYLINRHKLFLCFFIFNVIRKIKFYLIGYYERKN